MKAIRNRDKLLPNSEKNTKLNLVMPGPEDQSTNTEIQMSEQKSTNVSDEEQ